MCYQGAASAGALRGLSEPRHQMRLEARNRPGFRSLEIFERRPSIAKSASRQVRLGRRLSGKLAFASAADLEIEEAAETRQNEGGHREHEEDAVVNAAGQAGRFGIACEAVLAGGASARDDRRQ